MQLNSLNQKKILADKVKQLGFSFKLSDILFSCCKNDKIRLREKYYLDAVSLYNYNLDITTYFKKMTEIEIIKYYLFTENERNLISVISNPDFSHNQEEMKIKLNNQYKKFKLENFEDKLDILLKNVIVEERRNGNNNNKLLKLIKNGNQTLFN